MGGGQGGKLAFHLNQHRFGKGAVGGDQADTGAHVVLGLGQKIGRDHLGVAGLVGEDVDLGGAGKLVDADGAEDLALGLVHEGIAGAHDLHHRRNRLGPVGHGGDGLCAADAEDAVGPGQMAARDHRRMGVGGQAGDDLRDTRHLGRDDGHDRGGKQRKAPAGHIAAHAVDGDDAVAHEDAGERFHLERQDGGQLGLRKAADVGDCEFGIGAGLRIEGVNRRLPFIHRNLKRADLCLVEGEGVFAHRRIAARLHVGKDAGHQLCHRLRVVLGIAGGGFDPGDAGFGKAGHRRFLSRHAAQHRRGGFLSPSLHATFAVFGSGVQVGQSFLASEGRKGLVRPRPALDKHGGRGRSGGGYGFACNACRIASAPAGGGGFPVRAGTGRAF
jgi:hypothetical protein